MRPIVRTAAIWILALALVFCASLAAEALVGSARLARGKNALLAYAIAAILAAPPVVFSAAMLAVVLRIRRSFERIKLGKTLTLSCLGLGSLGGLASIPVADQSAAFYLGRFVGGTLAAGVLAVLPVGCACLLWNLLAARPTPSVVANIFD